MHVPAEQSVGSLQTIDCYLFSCENPVTLPLSLLNLDIKYCILSLIYFTRSKWEDFVYQEANNDLSREGEPDQVASSNNRSIFRSEALEHYIQNQEKVELPRLISVKLFRYLWIISLLLMIVGLLIVFWPLIEQFR